jgi:hypothetical protein
MRKLWVFLFGILVGGGLVGFGFKYHVVYTNDGLVLVPKQQATFADLYVDIRSWKQSDWQAHPELARSLVTHGRSDLLGGPASEFLRDTLRKFGNAEKVDDDFRME